ncbi:unnamed protein product, partial [marine sediment metagenome]
PSRMVTGVAVVMPGAGAGILKKALIAYRGVTDAIGTATSLECAALAALPNFNNQSVIILDGNCKGQSRDINAATTGGTVHVGNAFDHVIAAGVHFLILSLKPATAEVADLKTQIDKLAGEAPAESSVTKNWNTAVDSPDGTGGLLVNLGTAATRKKLHSILLDVSALTDGATIDVKLFIKINGVQKKVYDETFTIATDPDGLWIVNGTVGLHDVLSVAVYSDTNEGKAIGYTAMLEAM